MTTSPAPSLGTGALRLVAHSLLLDALAARTSRLLADADLDHLLIKGPATTRVLYPGEPGRRAYTDVDLLVPVREFDRAQAVLREHRYRFMLSGIRRDEYPWYETAWMAPEPDDLVIDLHRGFAGVDDSTALFDALSADRDVLQLGGAPVPVPGAVGSLFLVVVHAASPGRGRKPLADLRRATEVFDPHQWRAAAELARRCHATASFRAGLDLLEDGARYAEELDIDAPVALDQWLGGRQRDRVSVNLATALAQPTSVQGLRFAISKVVPSPALLRLRDPRASAGRLALLAAYGRRAALAVRSAPSAVADVRAAAAATGRATLTTSSGRSMRAGPPRALLRAAAHGDVGAVRAGAWAVWAWRRTRRQLAAMPLSEVKVPRAPRGGPTAQRAVEGALRRVGATCLERELVRQGWFSRQGSARVVVVGVRAPGDDFGAHAWLDGESSAERQGMVEILRWPAPAPAAPRHP